MGVKEVRKNEIGRGCQGMKWAEEAQGTEWAGLAGLLASKAQKKKGM